MSIFVYTNQLGCDYSHRTIPKVGMLFNVHYSNEKCVIVSVEQSKSKHLYRIFFVNIQAMSLHETTCLGLTPAAVICE